jgi:hypothetical protein
LANYQPANPGNSGSRDCARFWDPEAGSIFDASRGKWCFLASISIFLGLLRAKG